MSSQLVFMEPGSAHYDGQTSLSQLPETSVLDLKMQKTSHKKLQQTAQANHNLLLNIQKSKSKSIDKWAGGKTANNTCRPRKKGGNSMQKFESPVDFMSSDIKTGAYDFKTNKLKNYHTRQNSQQPAISK